MHRGDNYLDSNRQSHLLNNFKVQIYAKGFTYLWVLALLVIMSISLAAVGPMWSMTTQREREAELLRVGMLYVKAIEGYYHASPSRGMRKLPDNLDQLLLDNRFAGTIRHLRKPYWDPMSPGQPFEFIMAPQGGIIGVYSKNITRPILQTIWSDGQHVILPAEHYSDWKFIAKEDG